MKIGRHTLFLIVLLYCSACGVKSVTSPTSISPLNLPVRPLDTPTLTISAIEPTLTPTATIFDPPTATPTLTLEPSPIVAPSNSQIDVWLVPGTYSLPSVFKVEFSPDVWEVNTKLVLSPEIWELNTHGEPYTRLQHLLLSGCSINPTQGRGLPPDYSVEHTVRTLGDYTYELNITSKAGQLAFSSYCTINENTGICFAVVPGDNQKTCIQDAEVVLATLRLFEAPQPVVTP